MLNPMAVNLKVGSHLGKYRILEEIGDGPMAHVFLADDTILYRQVALKVLKPEFARDLPSGEGAEEEMSSAAVLLHSGIVPLYGTGSDNGYYYYSMSLMPGGNLRDALPRGLSPHQAVTILNQVSRALAFAHSKGINHQGIKPENILFRKDGSAVLSDFHTVKVHGFGIGVLGREPEPHPHYISPEQIQTTGRQFGRSDLYSLGIVFYEMLTGQVPYQGENASWQHINSAVPKLPGTLTEYQPLIDQLLAKKPSDRFADVNQLIKAMEKFTSKKPQDGSGKIAVLPLGAKMRAAAEAQKVSGGRPFIDGAAESLLETHHHALEALQEAPQTSALDDLPTIPLATPGLPDATHPLRSEPPVLQKPVVKSEPRPKPQRSKSPSAERKVEDFIAELPAGKKKAKKGEGNPRRKYLLAIALLAVLTAGGIHWWQSGSTQPSPRQEAAQGAAAPAASSSGSSPSAAENHPAWSAVEPEVKEQFSRALAYSREGRNGDAAALYLKMTNQAPLPEVYNNLAAIRAAEGNLDEAQRMLEEALRIHPSYATVFDNLNTIQIEKTLGSAYETAFLAPGEQVPAPRLMVLTEISEVPAVVASPSAAMPPQPTIPEASQPVAATVLPEATASELPPFDAPHDLISEVLADWSEAWSAQDFPRYLTFYGRDFQPGGGAGRDSWEQNRHRNVTTPKWIEVSLGDLSFSTSGPERLRVVAVQEYRSDRFRDRTLKSFEFGKEGDAWVILSEESLGNLR